MSQSTQDLIRDLATDLPPVRPLPRVRVITGAALAVSAPFYLYWYLTSGLRHQFRDGQGPDAIYLIVAAVMLTLAVGGVACGLASVIPGRESEARRGRGLFALGLAAGLALLLFESLAGPTPVLEGLVSSFGCVKGAALLAIPSGLIFARYVFMGAPNRLPVALALAGAGAMAVSASIVHLTCAHSDPMHMVLGHALAPLCGGLLLLVVASAAVAFGFGARGPTLR